MERKLDLSRLTDDEAKHVWEVIQRDFNLRKNEEERLGRSRLSHTDEKLTKTLCVHGGLRLPSASEKHVTRLRNTETRHATQKHRNTSRDSETQKHVTRLRNTPTRHATQKHVNTSRDSETRHATQKHRNKSRDSVVLTLFVSSDMYNVNEDDHGDGEAQRYKVMRKSKRLLSVHPLDFDSEEYFTHSRRASVQQMQEDRFYRNDVENFDSFNQRRDRRKSLDRYHMRPDDVENRMVRTRSLSKISSSVARQQYVDTSDEDEYQRNPLPLYQQPPHRRWNSKASSQENLGQAPPINELNKRMSAIESLLSRLEEKMTPGDETPSGPNEEEKLRRKLSELAGNLSDKVLSSDDESAKKSASVGRGAVGVRSVKVKELSSSSDEVPTQAQKVYIAAGQSYELETKLRKLEQNAKNRFGGTTDSELSELEDVVALTAARVQSAESEVSDIESKIAALSVAGSKKKVHI
ncbi:putative melanophilin-like [Scophthalmus maximus]|uniref:Putative melanophilin-like n=1 Tax=Scophthalmus maximus TaxID=52904 RepID=A0A2U9AV08_SCOMX|nr:putative melanophilin-like [Scophthalmus maximus]